MNSSRSTFTGATLFVIALSVFVTWPQARFLSTMVINHQDPYFSIWRISWIAHALSTAPRHLFDGNIFYPATGTLAYSDATMLEGLLATPLLWAQVPPVLVYNLLLLAGFAGSGLAMFVLARHATGSASSALVAAAVFTLAPYRIEHVMHLELQWAMFIPLTFWALHKTIETTSWRWGVLAGVCFWLQVLSCIYYGVFLALTLVAFVPAAVLLGRRERIVPLLTPLGVAGAVAVVLTIPFAMPYLGAAHHLGGRDIQEIGRYSATPASYLVSPMSNWLWGWTAEQGSPELRLFPGSVAMALALVSLFRRPLRPVIVYTIVAAVAVELSLGLNGHVGRLLFEHVPALQGFRSPSRFAIIACCALAMLAAFGADAVHRLVRSAPLAHRLAVPLLVMLMVGDYANGPMSLGTADPVEPPDVYKLLRKAPDGVVLELPVPHLDALPGQEPFYEAWSLWHWKPLVNGYSGYYPAEYITMVGQMGGLPNDHSIAQLKLHQVRYLVVHRAFYDPDTYTDLVLRLAARPEFKPWGAYRDTVGMADIFEFLPQ